MDRPIIEAKFFETYYFANAVRNILHNQFDHLRDLDAFYGDDKFAYFSYPFPRYSAFHCFIEFLLQDIIYDELDDIDIEDRKNTLKTFSKNGLRVALEDLKPTVLPIEMALRYYNINHISFDNWLEKNKKSFMVVNDDDIFDYFESLSFDGPITEFITRAVDEVFFILFQNRNLLLLFNDMMASQISSSEIEEIPEEYRNNFSKDGVLHRKNIPRWVQRAVFFRDRGLCVLCRKDLSGLLSRWNIENFDHIVPLVQGGLNDVTNIQLLCEECNKAKKGKVATSDVYEAWY